MKLNVGTLEVLNNTRKSVGARIRARRKQIEMTQFDLASKAGVSLRSVQDIESNRSNPRADTLTAIAEAMSVNAADLMPEFVSRPAQLSKSAVTDPTVLDAAECLRQLATISPERRAVVLGFLFDDHSFFPNDVGSSLEPVFSQLHGANG